MVSPASPKGDAEVVLTPIGVGTVLTYTAKASVGGKLAQIGQRLIDGAAKQIADDFFKRFAAALEVPTLVPDPEVDATRATSAKDRPGGAPSDCHPPIWVAGAYRRDRDFAAVVRGEALAAGLGMRLCHGFPEQRVEIRKLGRTASSGAH